MEKNKFEKDIRRELEGMKMTPSDTSWINVERRISKKKDRRLAGLLLLLFGLFISVGGYWWLNSKNDQQVEKIAAEETHISQKSLPSVPYLPDTASNGGVFSVIKGETGTTHIQKRNISKHQIPNHQSKNLPPWENGANLLAPAKNPQISNPQIEKSSELSDEKIFDKNPADSTLVLVQQKADDTHIIAQDIVKDSVRMTVDDHQSKQETVTKKNAVPSHGKNKWTWGFTFSAGSSYVRSSLLDVFSEEKSAAPSTQYDPGSATGNPQPNLIPSMPQHSLAFAAGIVAKREIGLRSKLSLGLGYKYLSTTNMVGSRVNNVSEYYFSNTGIKNKHRNSFHFVELPVRIEVRLTKANKLPVHWNGGIHVAQLIGSDALQFSSGRYFNDNSFFNKTQIGVSTGVDVTLFSKQKFPVNIGPTFYYGASKIAGKGLYGDTHFSVIGLRAEILFLKKK